MNLTLRKAHKLTKQLGVLIDASRNSIPQDVVQGDITLTDLTEANEKWNTRFKENIENRLTMIEVLYRIRSRIAVINSRKDNDGDTIDSLVNRKNSIEEKMKVVSFASQRWNENTNVDPAVKYQNELAYSESQAQRVTITSDTRKNFHRITVGNLTESTHTGYNEHYVDLKREQEQITDKLAYMNNYYQIELTTDEVEFLTSLQLI